MSHPTRAAKPARKTTPKVAQKSSQASTPAPELEPHGYAVAIPGSAEAAFVPNAVPPAGGGRAGAAKPPTSPGRAAAALLALAVAAFLVVSNEIMPLGLISLMAEDLGRTESEIGWSATIFALTVAIATVPLAMATSRLPRRPILVSAISFFALGTLIQATAAEYPQLLGGRVITGLAHALFWAVATPAAAGMFPLAMRGKSVSRLLLGASAAGVIGLPAATWLALRTDWHVPFWILTAAGAAVAAAIAIIMPNFRTAEGTVARGELPSRSRYIRILGIALLAVGSMAITWTYITPFYTEVSGFADAAMPWLLALGGAVGMVAMWLVGRFLDRWPVRSAVAGLAMLGTLWLTLAVGGASPAVAIGGLVLQGFAWSVLVASLVNWALRHTPWPSDIGNGAYAATFNLGNVIGSLVGASLLDHVGARWLPAASFVLVVGALALAWGVRPHRSGRTASRA